ncbi:MAG: hypothetical protein IJJ83_02260 [Muribaculaceae bacterium]|nr:hypothetical protein [Muribaculaceae bacterium]
MLFHPYNTLKISKVQQIKGQSTTISYQSNNYTLSDPLLRDFGALTENEDTAPSRPDAAAVTRHNTRRHALFSADKGWKSAGNEVILHSRAINGRQ